MMRFTRTAVFFVLCAAASAVADDTFFDSAGVRLHYLDDGEGEAVLLIHGFVGNASDWSTNGVHLHQSLRAAGFRVIAIDSRAHGESDAPHDPQRYGLEMVEDVGRVMDHVGVTRAHVVGVSLGGAIANKFRELHPDRVISLTRVASGLAPQDFQECIAETIASLERGEGILPMVRYFATRSTIESVTEEEIHDINQSMTEGRDQKALAALLKAGGALQTDATRLEKNDVPVLAIVGAKDPFLSGVELFAEKTANATLVVVEGLDHLSVLQSDEFVRNVVTFIRSHSAEKR